MPHEYCIVFRGNSLSHSSVIASARAGISGSQIKEWSDATATEASAALAQV
jgi:hypothetical protein